MAETTDRALFLVGAQDPLTKALLMQPLLGQDGDVCTPGLEAVRVRLEVGQHRHVGRIDRHREGQLRRVIPHDVHRPHGHIAAWRYPIQVDEWHPAPHREAQSLVVAVERDRKSTRLNSSHGYISYAV